MTRSRMRRPAGMVANLLFTACAVAAGSLPFEARAADLLQTFNDALSCDPVYASARSQYQATQEKYPQGLSQLLPTIIGTGSTSKTSLGFLNNSGVTSDFSTTGWQVTLTQPLFAWGRWESYKQGELLAAAGEVALVQARYDLITRTAQAYFDVLTAQDNLDLARSKLNSINQQFEQAKRNFEVGTATITDTNEAQSRLDLGKAAEIAAASDLDTKRGVLQQIIGKTPDTLRGLRVKAAIPGSDPLAPDDWIKQAEQFNPTVTSAQINLDYLHRDRNKAIAGHLPSVALTGARGYTNQTGTTTSVSPSQLYTTNIGVQVTISLFAGGYTQPRVRETIALEDKGRTDLESARRGAVQAARAAFLGVSSRLAQVKALEAAERSAALSLESNKLDYEVGVRINIDVLNAQDQLYATRAQLAKERYDTIVAGLRLKAAANVLKDEDVGLVNSLLADGSNPSTSAK